MSRGQDSHFDFGPERVAFEAVWSRQNYATLTEILAALPLHWRFFVKSKIFQAMRSAPAGCEPGRVHEAFATVRAAYPQIRT
jgi:N-methylhydantoinase B